MNSFFYSMDQTLHNYTNTSIWWRTRFKYSTARQAVHKKFNIKLHADPLSKRNMAERAIRGKFV